MIIIVEGIDRVGKTTLCNQLSDELNIPIFKKDRITSSISLTQEDEVLINVGHAHGLIDAWSMFTDNHIIVDRFYWTEYVYTKLQRCRHIPYEFVTEIEDHLASTDYFLVYVRPTDIAWSSNQHGSDLSEHLAIFDELYSLSRLMRVMKTDYNMLDNAFATIKGAIL